MSKPDDGRSLYDELHTPQPTFPQPHGQLSSSPETGASQRRAAVRTSEWSGWGVVGFGAIVLIIGLSALDWWSAGGSFSDTHRFLDFSIGVSSLAKAYFDWLALTLTTVLIVVAIAANLRSRASGLLRALGGIVAAAAIVVTFLALKLTPDSPSGVSDYVTRAGIGFYFALVGFVLLGIGALIGPRRN